MTQAAVADRIFSESLPVEVGSDGGEARLIERLRQGDASAFEQLVATYQPGVYRLIFRLLGDAEDARDVAQETFLRVYQKLEQFRGESNLKTWIYRIAMHQTSNYQRWRRRRGGQRTISIDGHWNEEMPPLSETLADERPDCEQLLIRGEREKQLARALSRLKRSYRVAVILRDIEGCSYEEIARILGISLGTVKSRIARGRERLRQDLVKHHPGMLDD